MKSFKIGKLSEQTGVGIETLRFYEKKGLLEPYERLPSGYRIYNQDSVQQVLFIQQARQLNYSLQEIKELLLFQLNSGNITPELHSKAERTLQDVRYKIQQLRLMERTLQHFVEFLPADSPEDSFTWMEALKAEQNKSLESLLE